MPLSGVWEFLSKLYQRNTMAERARSFAARLAIGSLMTVKSLWTPVAFGAQALIVDRSGRVLLARHSYIAGWSLPGGGVARGEPPAAAILRELKEEIGAVRSDPPTLAGVFSRRVGWVTNVIVLYRMINADVEFTPNMEVREILFCDPANPPSGTSSGTRRRLAEFAGNLPPSEYW
jgi:8-oxo-dGTP pyrophosphatase MutT (NUDIX family)